MSTLDHDAGVGERQRQVPFDSNRVGPCYVLQVQYRADQQLLTALEHASRCANAGAMLVEAKVGFITLRAILSGKGDA